ncbi:MAG: nucleotidyl transferase AbiEii/AbiGii toxin family protein [Anaerolineales bacterium]|jgi:predicted nucleotidyltransferase component of viral defense system
MLTRAQIQRIAQRHGIGAQAQERDYLQHLLLHLLYSRSQVLIFKGGTALRMVYHGNRYSEDLDFNGPADLSAVQRLWQRVSDDLERYGIVAEVRNARQSEAGYSFDVSYQGPLYDGRDRSKGKVRVDISLRQETVEARRELIVPEYDDVRPFVARVLTAEQLMAEKVRALIMRKNPRDVYDLWLLSRQGVGMRPELVSAKLAVYNLEPAKDLLAAALTQAQMDWERDLRSLLPEFVSWEELYPVVSTLLDELYLEAGPFVTQMTPSSCGRRTHRAREPKRGSRRLPASK